MSVQEVVVHARGRLGKGASGRIRRKGLLPCVVYGMGEAPVSICVDPKSVNKILRSEKGLNSVLLLKLDGSDESRHVMIKGVDRHAVSGRLVHLDFIRVDMNKAVRAVIPLEFTGSAPGVKLGGILALVRHNVEVESLPDKLPGVVTFDLSSLELNEVARVEDLPVLDGVTYLLDAKKAIAVVQAPGRVEEEVEEEAVAAS